MRQAHPGRWLAAACAAAFLAGCMMAEPVPTAAFAASHSASAMSASRVAFHAKAHTGTADGGPGAAGGDVAALAAVQGTAFGLRAGEGGTAGSGMVRASGFASSATRHLAGGGIAPVQSGGSQPLGAGSTGTDSHRSRENSGAIANTVDPGLRAGVVGAPTARAGAGNGASAQPMAGGSDDDIIASRLRRAAVEERDPVLRKKLWKEYLDYSKGVQAGQ